MANSPKFSIISVVFNAGNTLEKTILSIVNQTYDNIEYIIIDGCSKDNTIDLIKKYEHKISFWKSEPDKGLYDGMNKGIAAATGEYIWFINAGDEIYSETTVEKIAALNSKNADVFYGETMMIDENGIEIGMRRLSTPKKLTWKSFQMGMRVSHQSFIAKRTLCPLYDLNYRFSADFDWTVKILKNSKNIVNTELILSKFLDGGMTKKNLTKSLRERFKIMSMNYGYVRTLLNHLVLGTKLVFFIARKKRY